MNGQIGGSAVYHSFSLNCETKGDAHASLCPDLVLEYQFTFRCEVIEELYRTINCCVRFQAMDDSSVKDLAYGTALHFAAKYGRKNCLRSLIDVGADLKAVTGTDKTPLDVATDESIKKILVSTYVFNRAS